MVVQISEATLFPLLLILCLAVFSVFGQATSIPEASTEDDRMPSGLIEPNEIFIEVSVHFHESALNSYAYQDENAFWKTVDTYFKYFNHPEIRIVHNDTQILNDQGYSVFYNMHYIDSRDIWSRFQQYAYEKTRLNPKIPDISLLITRSKLCSSEDGGCDLPAVVYNRATCGFGNNSDEFESFAIVHSGVTYFAEVKNVIFAIGLLLGAETENRGGYFMSNTHYPAYWEVGWSRNSLDKIKRFANFWNGPYSKRACFFNKPNSEWEKKYNETDLPGIKMGIHDYCKRIMENPNSASCYTGDKLCRSMQCVHEEDKCLSVGPAPEGSQCASDKRCQYGKCEPWLTEKSEEFEGKSEKSGWDHFVDGIRRIADALGV